VVFKKGKLIHMGIAMSPEIREWLDKEAAEQKLTVAGVIRKILQEHYNSGKA